jgi:DNA-binding XRE family transcriptional regulator
MSSASVADTVLSETAPEVVADAAEEIAGTALRDIEASVADALEGERLHVRAYVDAFRVLEYSILHALSKARPDLIVMDEAHNSFGAPDTRASGQSGGESVPWLKAALEQEAMSAPFSQWVGSLGLGRGTAVAFVAQLRSLLPGTKPLDPPREHHLPSWLLGDQEAVDFYRAVSDELACSQAPLQRVTSALDINRTELARLFGVRRQAIEQWERRGVPGERQEKLATLDAIVDLLAAKLKPERIPGVVRRPAPAYGGRSILEALAAGDEKLVLDELRSAFDWASAA